MRLRLRKRTLRTIAITIGALLVLGVAAWWFRTPLLKLIPTPPVVVTVDDGGRVISLLQGQRLEVQLPANSYSGNRWHQGIPLPYVQEVGDSTFTQSTSPSKLGDGIQSTTFEAIAPGTGPLYMSLLPDSDQNSITPSMTFRVIVVVR